MAIVVFDPQEFREAYPRFVDPKTGQPLLTDAQLRQAFDVACLLLDNTDSSPVPYDPVHGVMIRKTLLHLLVCHLATLALWPVGQSGPVSSATEGSVSASFSVPTATGKAFYNQTPCGQAFWQAVQPYVAGGRYYAVRRYHPWGVGMANAHVLGGGKWKKVLEAVSKQAASLKVGVLEGATSEDGESVATYAFYNEFGATVEVPERTQTLYFKRNRDGTVGNRFVRKDKSDFAQDVAVGGHTITIPARPFMRSTVQAQKDAWAKAFADAIFAKAHERDAVVRGLNLLGRKMQDDIVATIKSNLAPDNAESTKRRKNAKGAGKGTLIDKGHLLKSISYEVEG